jgi:magnesium transporter
LTVTDPTLAQLKKIQAQFHLHELAMEDANSGHQRPKLEQYGETYFLALHTARLKGEEFVYGEVHVFVSGQFVILIQHGDSVAFDKVPTRFESCLELFQNGSGFALYAVLDHLVDQFILVAAQLQRRLDELESAIFEHKLQGTLVENLYELKRDLAHLYNVASPVADICKDLLRLDTEIATPELHPYYRDVQDHVARVLRSLGMLREALSDAMQLNLAMMTVRQNEVVKRLAGWGAILGVPSVVFGMYGMNFKYMPEYDWTLGYPVTVLLTAYGCRQLYLKLKQSGWL